MFCHQLLGFQSTMLAAAQLYLLFCDMVHVARLQVDVHKSVCMFARMYVLVQMINCTYVQND